MKKVLSIILCTAFLMVMLATAVSAAVPGDDAQNQVNFAKGTAVIDGTMDDCYKAAGEIKAVHPGSEDFANFATFSGYAVYDSDAVYLWGHVSDSTLSANNGSWNGDGMEIFFNYDLASGVGATDQEDTYGDTGCMQFRIIPIPADEQARIEVSSGHGYDDEIKEDSDANPNNYYCVPDADNKGYTVEIKFPFPTAAKAAVKSGYAIGFSIQINDAQDGNPTTTADRTGTVHSQYSEDFSLIGSCWQWSGAMGRAFFTDAVYAAPVEEPAATDAPVIVAEDTTSAPAPSQPSPTTGDNSLVIAALMILAGAGVVILSKKIFAK